MSIDDCSPTATMLEYSKDGNLLSLISPTYILILDTEQAKVLHKIDHSVSAFSFSPCSNYFLTWERLVQNTTEKQSTSPNLIVWKTANATPIAHFTHRQFSPESW